jgi:hypothetical protein
MVERDLKTVLDVAVKIANQTKFRLLNTRVFKLLCEEMGSENTTLLLHTEIRWLFRGEALIRVFDLCPEIYSFFLLITHFIFLTGKYILAAEIGILSRHFYKN